MSDSVRLNVQLRVSATTAATIKRLAKERNVANTGLFLQALGLLHVAHDAGKDGWYVGTARKRDRLETVLTVPTI
jgi:hypothetical protein